MVLEGFPNELVRIGLVGKNTALAHDLPFNIPHVTLCYEHTTPKIIAFKDLLEDHLFSIKG